MDWNNNAEVLKQVKTDGLLLQHASDRLKDDWSIVETAVGQNGFALQYASDNLRDHSYIVGRAVHQNCYAFQYASEKVRSDEYLVHGVLKKDNSLFAHVSETLRDNLLFMRKYVLHNYHNAAYLSERLKNDKELAYMTIITCKKGLCLQYFGPAVKEDESIVLKAIQLTPLAYNYASPILRNNPSFIAKVLPYAKVEALDPLLNLAMFLKKPEQGRPWVLDLKPL
jgi:hypothetical protein